MSSALLRHAAVEHTPVRGAAASGQKLAILLVGAVEDHADPESSVFDHFQWPMERAENYSEALRMIRRDLHRVIVSERDLPDGSWKDVLEAAAARENPPIIIVASRQADEYLWAEVLNLGGYDVLAKPLDREEVHRAITLAWQHWQSRQELATKSRRHKRGEEREGRRREN